MANYKITNITDRLGKRDFKSNSELEIKVISGMTKKSIKLKPKDSVYLETNSLPLSVHRLRVKGLITVVQVDEKEIPKPKPTPSKPKKKPSKTKSSSSTSTKKSSSGYTKKKTSGSSSTKRTYSKKSSSSSGSSTTKTEEKED